MFFYGDSQLRRLERSEADRVEVRFRDHKGDQAQVGSVFACTRSEVRSPRSDVGEGGGAVALMVALLSCHAALPEHAPRSCLLYTSPSPRDKRQSRMPSSA